ncbi:MAG: glycosyltransferase [Gammaproteobacteria bacterium]|nr:glycosyltransferase [Gammaproteobacteria bacterium]
MAVDYSIIVPAYNEAKYLPASLKMIQQAMDSIPLKGEIIVTDNNSSDNTAELAQQLGARVVFEPVNQISRARNAGARAALGKYLVFVDADTHISPEVLKTALDNLQSGECCGGGAVVTFDHEINQAQAKALSVWIWISTQFKLGSGCFLYCTKADFDSTGGFSEAVYASEEIWFSRSIKRLKTNRGKTFQIITDYPVISSGRKFEWFSMWQQTLLLIMLTVFPYGVFSRRFCAFWYKRPNEQK